MKKLIKKILREHRDPRLNQPLQVGDVIELMYMDDPYNPIPPMTRGVVMGFEPTPGEDKILVRWILDAENEEFRNMPMIPEVDIWRKITPELKEQTESSTPDEKIDNLGLPQYMQYDHDVRKHVPASRVSPQLFFKITKSLVDDMTKDSVKDIADALGHINDSGLFTDTLKLYGVNTRLDRLLSEKLFWAIHDNWDKFNSDNPPQSYEELELRPIKKYEVPITDFVSRSVAIDYIVTEYGFSADEVYQLIENNEDGEYVYYEWDMEDGYHEEVGDEHQADSSDIGDPREVGVINESKNKRIIKENPSPEENDIIDDLKELVRTWDACESDMPVACKYKTQIQEVIYKYTNLPLTEDYMSHSTEPTIGDNVKNNNPGCTHYGSEGVIEDINDLPDEVGKTITYRVTNDGENYSNGDILTKTMDQLIPLQEPMNEGSGGRGGSLPVYEFDKIDNKIVQNLLKQYTCGEIDQMNRYSEEYVHGELSDMLKLYGRHLSPSYEYYPKQLVQFIVDKGCPDDYTQFMGERLPDINQYAIDMTYTETDVVAKTAEVVINDTNFQSAMCAARENFWDYEPDTYDTEIIDSDYQGNEEWTNVTVNGTTKWNIHGGSKNDDNYNPTEVDC